MVLGMSFGKRTAGMNTLAVFLILLIILNLAFIWVNSAKISSDSDKTSSKIAKTIVEKTVKDFDSLPKSQQQKKINEANGKVRSTAHFAEFIPLGFLVFFLYLNMIYSDKRKRRLVFGVILSVFICALCALSDEIHQIFVKGRSFEFKDILVDTLGSLVGIASAVFIYLLLMCRKTKHI